VKKKIYLIQPTYHNNDGRLLKGRTIFMHSLALPALSSTIPDDWEKEFCLEYFEEVNYDTDASVVGITSMGYDVLHGCEIAEAFKKRGKIVLYGGHQAEFSEDLLGAVADAIVHGHPSRDDMARILSDAESGRLAPKYCCGFDIDFPFDYSVLSGKRARFMPVVTSVGCRNCCEYCCTAAMYRGRYHLRELDSVLADLREVCRRTRCASFVDANLYNDRDYLLRLCSRMTEGNLGLRWGAQSTIDVGDDPEALSLLRKAGCRILFIGLESINQEGLDWVRKRYLAERYGELVRRIREAKIAVAGFFMLGLDGDDGSTFQRLFDFIHESRVAVPILNLLLPVPGTRIFERLNREGRLLLEGPDDFLLNNPVYNTTCNRCLFLPRQMTVSEAESGYLQLGRRLFSFPEMLRRSAATNPLLAATLFIMNLDLRRKARSIAAEHNAG
jgi:hypothetical protein